MRVFLLLPVLFHAVALGEDLLYAGRQAMERGDYREAEHLFRQQIAKTPHSAEALSNLGAVLAREEKFDDAVRAYQSALQANPNLTPVYFNLGVAYFRAGRYETAIGPFETFLQSQRGDLRARELLAVSLVESARYKRGIDELDRLNAEKPDNPAILFALAGAHIRAGDEGRGKQLLQQLETMNLSPASVHLLRGMLFYRSRLYEEAECELREALRLDPKSASALAALGRLRLRLNDDAAAIDFLEKALAIQPQDAESNYQLGVLLSRNGREDQGRQYLMRAREQRVDYPDPLYFLAKIEMNRRRPAAAIQYLERAAQLAPNQENIRYMLARAYKQSGQDKRASAELTEFRRLQSERLQRDREAIDPERPLDPTRPVAQESQL